MTRLPAPIPALFGLGLGLLLSAPSAHAASFDPDLSWRTIQTEHFRIHFHQGEEQLADEFTVLTEEVYDRLVPEVQWSPNRRIEVILVDRTDSANGYALTSPYPTIVIYTTAPTDSSSLGHYEDWSETVFTHELAHILHLDTTWGLSALGRHTVGRVSSVNSLSPGWVIEGFGTFEETRNTTGGRGRAPLADMVKRSVVVDDAFPPIDTLDGYQPDPPAGNLRYLFGQDFLQHVSDNHGDRVWTDFIHTYGAGLPYIYPTRHVFGARFPQLYSEWRADFIDRYNAQLEAIAAEGVREGALVSDGEGSCIAPAFSPDGTKLVWSCSDRATGSSLWLADGEGKEAKKLLQDRGASNFTWRADSESIVYGGAHVVNRFNTWNDIYLLHLDSNTPTALTSGKRARDPDFSPDGTRLVVVTNANQDNQLEILTVDRRQTPITNVSDHTQFSRPRFSPDGQTLAVSVWADGRRDLWLYGIDGTPLRRLTHDVWNDRDAEWSADGRYLFFSSDRTGVPNIFAIEIGTEHLWQITNVRSGATRPTVHPGGTRLAYQQYSTNGWDIALMDLHPSDWLDRGILPRDLERSVALIDLVRPVDRPPTAEAFTWVGEPLRPSQGPPPVERSALRQDDGGIDSFDQAQVEQAFDDKREDYPFTIAPKRYKPARNLVPTWWLPGYQRFSVPSRGPLANTIGSSGLPFTSDLLGDGGSSVFSARTSMSDPLQYAQVAANASYRSDVDAFSGAAGATVNRWLPVFSVSVSSTAQFISGVPLLNPDDPDVPLDTCSPTGGWQNCYYQRQNAVAAGVSYPYTFRTTLFGSYRLSSRQELDALPSNADLSRVPLRGTVGQLSMGWRYSWSQQNPYAISWEDGRFLSLVGSLLHPALGTKVKDESGELVPLTQAQLTADWREYIVNPWIPNHVLAIRTGAGATFGDTARLGRFRLGGNNTESLLYATPEGSRMLRGYPFNARAGDMYWLGGAEYRFPITRIDRGVSTLPVFFRVLSGAAFVDSGNAFTDWQGPTTATQGALVSTGVELRLSAILGHSMGFTGTVGWAKGLTDGGYSLASPQNAYVRLGGSF